ncbi:hypothetical protein KC19_5G008600 [Ceratodon purpureus]|uniref:Uncharacterized protein n=1 Tax=Ceratodon purpureus TaxID=3225 RepID=A0A8T0HWQ9_CERPU|nr:hypothetical protein KC19_5G008600 [Ceratodon purpureus]
MGNLGSSNRYEKVEVVRRLWKLQRAVPVLPISPHLIPLLVLSKRKDGYHVAGDVFSLCKPGNGKDWLKDVRPPLPRRKNKYFLPPKSIGQQTYVFSDDDGALAKALVGSANAAVWFKKFESIEVCISECEIREFNIEKWDEMMEHFDPDLQTTKPGSPECLSGNRELFIVQKVLLVSQIKITASYKGNAGPEVKSNVDPEMPSQGVNIEASFRTTSSSIIGEFALSAKQKNQKLPVAFSGFSYTYDKFGVREHFGKGTRCQADAEIGESSGASEEADSDDDDPQDDPNMGGLVDFNDGWFANVKPNPSLEIYPYVEESQEPLNAEEEEEEEEDEDEVVDPNAPG